MREICPTVVEFYKNTHFQTFPTSFYGIFKDYTNSSGLGCFSFHVGVSPNNGSPTNTKCMIMKSLCQRPYNT